MPGHHLKLIIRNLVKERQSSLLNLAGLCSGLACSLLIFLWISDEWQIDRFNANDNRLFQVMENWENEHRLETTPHSPGLLAYALATDIPAVEYAVPVIPPSWFDKKGILISNGNRINASAEFAGKDFFKVFSYKLLQGNPNNPLNDPHSVLISDELAEKLFQTTTGIVGKTVEWNQKDYSGPYRIAGIFEKPPVHAREPFDLLFCYDLFLSKNPKLADWRNNDPYTYVLLKPATNLQTFNATIKNFVKSKDHLSQQTLFAQRFSDRYLHDRYENGAPAGGRIEYVKLFSIVAIFILLIACINYMNLSTARAAGRMKEAGIKKVMGANRWSLVMQYLSESMLLSLIAVLASFLLVILLLPVFNGVTGKQLNLFSDPKLFLLIPALTVFTGILAGAYPAFYLSGFRISDMLKRKLKNSIGELWIRKGLVIFQFTLSAVFIISVLVIYRQMRLIETKNLGYNREHVLYFDLNEMQSGDINDYKPGGRFETGMANFIERVRQVPGVAGASNFRHSIVDRAGGTSDLSWPGKDPNSKMDFTDLAVGYGFIEALDIKMQEGRTYSGNFGSEHSKIIFNELAIERMGIKDPIGKTVHLWGEDREIIGIAKNFNFQSLYQDIKPCFFDLSFDQRSSKIIVRIQAGQENLVLEKLAKLYKENSGGIDFEYKFLDDDYQALYSSEIRVAALSEYFAGLAILISCLGLFGLAAYTAQRKQKEISIRKIVGATVGNIVAMLTTGFMKLILVAMLVAFPLSWWLMHAWLTDFAYHVAIGLSVFLVAGAVMLMLTALTISFHALKAATSNPVTSLKTE